MATNFLVRGLAVLALAAPASALAQADAEYDPEAKLAELGITLPPSPEPVANYVNGVRTGNLIFLAGKGPKRADGSELRGKLGADLTIEQGYEGARITAIEPRRNEDLPVAQLAVPRDLDLLGVEVARRQHLLVTDVTQQRQTTRSQRDAK